MHPVKDASAVVAAQVQVLQPDEVATVFGTLDDSLHIRYAGEDRRDETGGVDTRFIELTHDFQTAFDTDRTVHLRAEVLVQRVDGPTDAGAGESLDQVEVAENQVRLGGDTDPNAGALQLFQHGAGTFEACLVRLVGVGHGAEERLFACQLSAVADGSPVLDIDELAPRLGVVGEPLHERGVAILAGVYAAHIRIDGIIADRQVGLGQNVLGCDFLYVHLRLFFLYWIVVSSNQLQRYYIFATCANTLAINADILQYLRKLSVRSAQGQRKLSTRSVKKCGC